jgi:hypothetical protein
MESADKGERYYNNLFARNNLFAPHPSCFATFGTADPHTIGRSIFNRDDEPRLPYTLTNRGLQMSVRLYGQPASLEFFVVLDYFKKAHGSPVRLAMVLRRAGFDWERSDGIGQGTDTAVGAEALSLTIQSPTPDLSTVYILRDWIRVLNLSYRLGPTPIIPGSTARI